MKNILLVTAGIFHPPFRGRNLLHNVLQEMNGFSFEHIGSLEHLPMDVEKYSAVVLHFHHKRLSNQALRRLDAFVKNGGGVLALHAATASFKENLPYFQILGGRFIGHGPLEQFELVNCSKDIFNGMANFTVKDELYIHELNPNIQVHYTAKHDGQDVPVVWTYNYGKGKVCYACPGHRTATMANPTYQQVLKRGLEWVTA